MSELELIHLIIHHSLHIAKAKWGKNVLGYCRKLGSLRYGNKYCVEYRCLVWENPFFPLKLKPILIMPL